MMKTRSTDCSRAAAVVVVAACIFAGALLEPSLAAQRNEARPIPASDSTNVGVLPVQGNIYMLVGVGSNVTLQVGPDGVLVVDTQVPQTSAKIIAAIEKLTDKPIRWIINTTSDVDHTGGNAAIAKAGKPILQLAFEQGELFTHSEAEAGATLVANENTLSRINPRPAATSFDEKREMFFNGEPIAIYHQPAAHTDGDSIVFFRHSDVISAGDVFVTTSYPVIDIQKGGSVNGEIDALNRIIDITVPREKQEGGTYVISGHGRLADEADVVEYRDMVTIIRDRIKNLIGKGMTLEQIRASKPTLDYDGLYGATTGPWTTDMFIEAVYRSLSAAPAPQRR